MKKLVFKLDYAGKILSGEKTTTIRLQSHLKEGDIVEVYVGHVRVGRAIIRKVIKKKLTELTDDDAQKDGFRCKDDLIKALSRIYGRSVIESNPDVYIIEFNLL